VTNLIGCILSSHLIVIVDMSYCFVLDTGRGSNLLRI